MKRLATTTLLTLIALLIGLALAQNGETNEATLSNIREWFSNPALAVLAVAGFVEWLRHVKPGLDGPIVVPGIAVAVGVIGGALGQLFGMLSVEPFTTWTTPIGGIAYGLTAGISAVLGVNLFDLGVRKLLKAIPSGAGGDTVDPDPRSTASAQRLRG